MRVALACSSIALACLALLLAGMTVHPTLRFALVAVALFALLELARILWLWRE